MQFSTSSQPDKKLNVYVCACVCLWLIRSHQMYYMFGFLFVVFIILIVTCSETAILLCYFQLRAEVR